MFGYLYNLIKPDLQSCLSRRPTPWNCCCWCKNCALCPFSDKSCISKSTCQYATRRLELTPLKATVHVLSPRHGLWNRVPYGHMVCVCLYILHTSICVQFFVNAALFLHWLVWEFQTTVLTFLGRMICIPVPLPWRFFCILCFNMFCLLDVAFWSTVPGFVSILVSTLNICNEYSDPEGDPFLLASVS